MRIRIARCEWRLAVEGNWASRRLAACRTEVDQGAPAPTRGFQRSPGISYRVKRIRPGPRAPAQITSSGSIRIMPSSRSWRTFRWTAALAHIFVFMAGASTAGYGEREAAVLNRSSTRPRQPWRAGSPWPAPWTRFPRDQPGRYADAPFSEGIRRHRPSGQGLEGLWTDQLHSRFGHYDGNPRPCLYQPADQRAVL